MPRLKCERCGLIYAQAAIARHLPMATGCACRRCGGRLEAEDPLPGGARRRPVVAVRSAISGEGQVPYG